MNVRILEIHSMLHILRPINIYIHCRIDNIRCKNNELFETAALPINAEESLDQENEKYKNTIFCF